MKFKINFLITAILLSVAVNFGQGQNPPTKTNLGTSDVFFLDVLNYKSAKEGQTKIEFFLQVPYHSLQFVKGDNEFISKYTVTSSFFDEEGKNLFAEKMWNEKISVKEYKETMSKKKSNISRRTFYLEPNIYLLRTSVYDKETKKEFVKTIKFNVRDFSSNISLSSILFALTIEDKNGNKKIIPNVSRNVVKQTKGIPIYYEIYSDKKMELKAEYSIVDDNEDETLFTETVPVKIDSGINNIIYTAKDTSVNLGEYNFKITLLNNDDDDLASTSRIFFSKWTGAPSNIKDLKTAIEQLEYIATDEQKSYIEEATTKEEKIKRYKEFWKSKDPNPANEENQAFDEYYRRINLANKNFKHYNRPGWKTDRGMVFIVLGPPNNIDDHPFDSYSKPYVVWEYYDLNRSFTFVDVTGFGDYRLANPLDFDYFRYR